MNKLYEINWMKYEDDLFIQSPISETKERQILVTNSSLVVIKIKIQRISK